MPLFLRPEKYSNFAHNVVRVLGSLLLLKLGYRLAEWEYKDDNEAFARHKVVEFHGEEQIYDYLFHKGKDAVFLHMYRPGHTREYRFRNTIEKESSNPRYDNIVFMSVHCRKHLTFCINKAWPNRNAPYAELYYINEND